jgi:hypothetical protein
MFDGGGNAWHQSIWGYNGMVGIQREPQVTLDVVQGGDVRVGNANLSSGGNYMHLANNEYYNGGAWVATGSPGVLLQFTGQETYFYAHNGAGGHTNTAAIVFNGAGGDFYSTGSVESMTGCSAVASFAPNTNPGCGGYLTNTAGVYAREAVASIFLSGPGTYAGSNGLSIDALCCPCPAQGCNL